MDTAEHAFVATIERIKGFVSQAPLIFSSPRDESDLFVCGSEWKKGSFAGRVLEFGCLFHGCVLVLMLCRLEMRSLLIVTYVDELEQQQQQRCYSKCMDYIYMYECSFRVGLWFGFYPIYSIYVDAFLFNILWESRE